MSYNHHTRHTVDKHIDVMRELFVEAEVNDDTGYGQSINNYYAHRMGNNENISCYLTFKIPDDFVSLIHVHPVIIPLASGNVYWSADSSFAAAGEPHTIHGVSLPFFIEPVTINILAELQDIHHILRGVAKGDYVGILFNRNAINVNDTCEDTVYFLGILIQYIGEQ